MEVPVNHEEAEQLAQMKREESNLARCYLDMKLQNSELRALLDKEGMTRARFQGELMAVNRLIEGLRIGVAVAAAKIRA